MMNLYVHREIASDISNAVDAEPVAVSPGLIAVQLIPRYVTGPRGPQEHYCLMQHLKHMTRRVLAGRGVADLQVEEEVAPGIITDRVFPTKEWTRIQTRYPLPGEGMYQRVDLLGYGQLMWNAERLRTLSNGLRLHALELEAYARAGRVKAA